MALIKIFTVFENTFAVLGILFFSGAFSQIVPDKPISLLRYAIWGITFILLCLPWKNTLSTICLDKFLLLLAVLIFMSFLWSDISMSTLKDNREIIQMTFFGWYLATRFLLKEQIQIIAVAFLIGALMSLFVCLAVPAIGIHTLDHPGAWKGVYGYKNNLSSMMVICAFTFFLLPINSQNLLQKLYKYGGLGLAIAIILLSTSKTSLVISFLLFFILTFYRNYRWQGKVSVVFLDLLILFLGGVATIVLSSWSELLTSLGKDPTLTGRTPMWGVALTRLMERPLFGFGRGAFWAPNSPYAKEAGLAVANGFVPPHGHNGFIDLGLDVGLIGFSLFAISFLISYFRSLKVAYATKDSENLWFLAFLLFLFMNNITESFLLYKSNIYWTFYVSTALSLAKMDLSSRGRGLEVL
jgi:exopolysaccharide production protein ExoQ